MHMLSNQIIYTACAGPKKEKRPSIVVPAWLKIDMQMTNKTDVATSTSQCHAVNKFV